MLSARPAAVPTGARYARPGGTWRDSGAARQYVSAKIGNSSSNRRAQQFLEPEHSGPESAGCRPAEHRRMSASISGSSSRVIQQQFV
jgi:hypothetical protein